MFRVFTVLVSIFRWPSFNREPSRCLGILNALVHFPGPFVNSKPSLFLFKRIASIFSSGSTARISTPSGTLLIALQS